MKKKLPLLFIAALLVIFWVLASAQRPHVFYPELQVDAADPGGILTLDFLFDGTPSQRVCDSLTGNIARVVLNSCKQCRVKRIQCARTLDESQQILLTNEPLSTASGRMSNGVVTYQAANAALALAACQATERQSATGSNPVRCFAANTPRMKSTHWPAPSLWSVALLFAASTAAAWFAGWFIVKYEHLHAHLSHDQVGTGPQKYHTQPTPRIGGLVVMVGLLAAGSAMLFTDISQDAHVFELLMLAGVPAFLGGLVEDLTKKVGVLERLLLTMLSGTVAALLLDAVLARVDIPGIDQALLWAPFAVIFTSFAVGGIANAVNIIDGFNGLAGGFAVIVLTALAYVAYLVGDSLVLPVALALIASLLGFLAWNWPSGKIFLGDGGAYLLGFLMAELSVLLVTRNPSVSPWFPMLLLIYPVFETFYSIYRRKIMHGASPGQPDNKHLHQLIHDHLVLRASKYPATAPRSELDANNCVAQFLYLPAVVTATLGAIFWQTTMALIGLSIAYCVFYVVIYRRIARKSILIGSRSLTAS